MTFKNVIQPERDVIVNNNFKFKGNWSKLIFKNKNPIVVELGCGKGEYSVALAKENPEINSSVVSPLFDQLISWDGIALKIEPELLS